MNSSLLDQHKYNNYNTDEFQNNQSNSESNPNEIKDLYIS